MNRRKSLTDSARNTVCNKDYQWISNHPETKIKRTGFQRENILGFIGQKHKISRIVVTRGAGLTKFQLCQKCIWDSKKEC